MNKNSRTPEQALGKRGVSTLMNLSSSSIVRWVRFASGSASCLPKRLHSKRGYRGWRYWTDEQVYGKNGIIVWMEKNDMRPGNLVTDRRMEAQHVANLRKPKYLDGYHIRSAKHFADKGKSREWIIKKLFPRTRYARPENLEAALEKVFAQEGWYFPPSIGKLSMLPDRVEREVAALEREVEKIELRETGPRQDDSDQSVNIGDMGWQRSTKNAKPRRSRESTETEPASALRQGRNVIEGTATVMSNGKLEIACPACPRLCRWRSTRT